jgi:hypothetical protein
MRGMPAGHENYNNFTNMNLLCTGHPGFVHLLENRLQSTERLADSKGALSGSNVADGAEGAEP